MKKCYNEVSFHPLLDDLPRPSLGERVTAYRAALLARYRRRGNRRGWLRLWLGSHGHPAPGH